MDFDDENPDDETCRILIERARSGDRQSAISLIWHILGYVAEAQTAPPALRDYAREAKNRLFVRPDESEESIEPVEKILHLKPPPHRPKSLENELRDWLLACLIATHIAREGGKKKCTIEKAVLALTAIPNFKYGDRVVTRAWSRCRGEAVVFPHDVEFELIHLFTPHV